MIRAETPAIAAAGLLGLPGFRPTAVEDRADVRRIRGRMDTCGHSSDGAICPSCRIHDLRPLALWDVPLLAVPTRLEVTLPRRRCRTGAVVRPRPDFAAADWPMTRRLAEHLGDLCLSVPLARVAALTGLPRRALSRFRRLLVEHLDAGYHPLAPRLLGIDQVHILGREYVVLTDIEARRVIDLIPANRESSVRAALGRLRERERVEAAVIDLHHPYRRALAAELPWAVVIADVRHVLELSRRPLMRLRSDCHAVLPRTMTHLAPGGRRRDRISALLSSREPEPEPLAEPPSAPAQNWGRRPGPDRRECTILAAQGYPPRARETA